MSIKEYTLTGVKWKEHHGPEEPATCGDGALKT